MKLIYRGYEKPLLVLAVIFNLLVPLHAGASSGYEACRAENWSHDTCMYAGGGYQACRAENWSHDTCMHAGGGYQACRAENWSHDTCMQAAGGYEACRAENWSHDTCMHATDGYGACRAENWNHDTCMHAGIASLDATKPFDAALAILEVPGRDGTVSEDKTDKNLWLNRPAFEESSRQESVRIAL